MGDSDDDYDSMGKRRGQSRNKFRKEREEMHGNSLNEMDSGVMRRSKDMANGGSSGRMHQMQSSSNAYGHHNDFRRRSEGPPIGNRYTNKDLDDLDEDDLAHQAYRDVGFR